MYKVTYTVFYCIKYKVSEIILFKKKLLINEIIFIKKKKKIGQKMSTWCTQNYPFLPLPIGIYSHVPMKCLIKTKKKVHTSSGAWQRSATSSIDNGSTGSLQLDIYTNTMPIS